MLVPCVTVLQPEPNTNLGMGGIKIFALFFRNDSKQPNILTCSRSVTSASPKRCHPPPLEVLPPVRESSTCLKRTLVFPKRSSTTTDNASKLALWIRLAIFSSVFELRCQLFSVRSVTLSPEVTKCRMVHDMWLEPVMIMLREGVGGMSFTSAAPPALATLAAMIPGSMPAESEAFSSSASLRTIRDLSLQQSRGAVAGHL